MSYQTNPKTVSMPQSGDILLGRYVIEGTITRGGFSIIYRGRQLGVDRTVAIKCLDPESIRLDPAAPQRFAREARMSSGLQHPNTITIFDYGRTERGILFLVMEYVEGVSLNRILRYGRIDPDRAVHLVQQILLSLREAHNKSIIHRDLKPANIMVCDRAGEQDVVKVLDFGIAKALETRPEAKNLTAEVTGNDRVIGTPRYMSPEQLRGEPVSAASDLYSVGLIFYEMLVGKPAIDQGSAVANMSVQMSEVSVPVPTDGTVPERFVDVLRKAIDKHPSYRFQSAKDFISALDGSVEGQLVVGRVDEEEGNTRPMEAEEIAAAKAISRAGPGGDGGVNFEPSGAYPLVGYGATGAYGRSRLLLMFNVLLAVFLVAVGVTLGVLLVTLFGDKTPQVVAPEQVVAAPEPETLEPTPMPVATALPPVEPVAVRNETEAERATRAANVRLGVQTAQRDLSLAVASANTTVEPLTYVFTGHPTGADVFSGTDQLGVADQTLYVDRSQLPMLVEVRHAEFQSMYTQLSAERTGIIHYNLLPVEPPVEPGSPSVARTGSASDSRARIQAATRSFIDETPSSTSPSREAEPAALPPPSSLSVEPAPSRERSEPERDERSRSSSRRSRAEPEEPEEPPAEAPVILLIDEPAAEEPAAEEPAEEEAAEDEPVAEEAAEDGAADEEPAEEEPEESTESPTPAITPLAPID